MFAIILLSVMAVESSEQSNKGSKRTSLKCCAIRKIEKGVNVVENMSPHGGDSEEYHLLDCGAFGRSLPSFQRNILPSSSGSKHKSSSNQQETGS
jgi:hypothetical protein